MKIELLPVLEIANYGADIGHPEHGPYWKYPEEYAEYHRKSLELAGYDPMIPYLQGGPFYTTTAVSDRCLEKLVLDHTAPLREKDGERDHVCPLFGGLVLRVDDEDKFFPQCCCDLSDIFYYERLSGMNSTSFYQGHPIPNVEIREDRVIFDFTVKEHDESFVPPPPETILTLDFKTFARAVTIAKEELIVFAERVKAANIKLGLNIPEIDKLLVWGG